MKTICPKTAVRRILTVTATSWLLPIKKPSVISSCDSAIEVAGCRYSLTVRIIQPWTASKRWKPFVPSWHVAA